MKVRDVIKQTLFELCNDERMEFKERLSAARGLEIFQVNDWVRKHRNGR